MSAALIFDPLLAGPSAHGGPFALQVWSRRSDGDFVRVHAGSGPVQSPALDAWLVVVGHDAALARVAELEATLAARSSS